MQYQAALYMRLSRDDGTGESSGIESQRLLLRNYAEKNGYKIFDEYIDDGYSGTRYDRPAFQKMMTDIEDGKINMVITKDLSRLGRNYITSGELTDVYFPEHRIRFIAINDSYDSGAGEDDMAPFRHVMNEMYARDISRKIRTALKAKMEDGQYIGSFAPYGYRKSDNNKNTLIPDSKAAKTVQRIFSLAAGGYATREIADILNFDTIPVPLDYRRIQKNQPSENRKWTVSGICKILRNQTYIGHTVQGKNEKISFKSSKSYTKPPQYWIVVKNTHIPLVSEEIFLKAQRKKERSTH